MRLQFAKHSTYLRCKMTACCRPARGASGIVSPTKRNRLLCDRSGYILKKRALVDFAPLLAHWTTRDPGALLPCASPSRRSASARNGGGDAASLNRFQVQQRTSVVGDSILRRTMARQLRLAPVSRSFRASRSTLKAYWLAHTFDRPCTHERTKEYYEIPSLYPARDREYRVGYWKLFSIPLNEHYLLSNISKLLHETIPTV